MDFIILAHNFNNGLRTISYTLILDEEVYKSELEFLNKHFLNKIFLCRNLEIGKVFSGSWEILKMEEDRVRLEYFSKGSKFFGYEADNYIFLENLKNLMSIEEYKLSAENISNNILKNIKMLDILNIDN